MSKINKNHIAVLQKWIRNLKTFQSKKVNTFCKEIAPEIESKIDCLSCANCCKNFSPILTHSDILRIAKFKNIAADHFIKLYLKKDEEGDWVMKTQPCPMLLSDNRCSIYEARPKSCAQYPLLSSHDFYDIKTYHEKNIAHCPITYETVGAMMKNLK